MQWVADVRYLLVLLLLSDDLLKNTAGFVEKLMEGDEDICSEWGSPDMVLAVLEAIKQTGLVLYLWTCIFIVCLYTGTSWLVIRHLYVMQIKTWFHHQRKECISTVNSWCQEGHLANGNKQNCQITI